MFSGFKNLYKTGWYDTRIDTENVATVTQRDVHKENFISHFYVK